MRVVHVAAEGHLGSTIFSPPCNDSWVERQASVHLQCRPFSGQCAEDGPIVVFKLSDLRCALVAWP
jgi:hypothetical protein